MAEPFMPLKENELSELWRVATGNDGVRTDEVWLRSRLQRLISETKHLRNENTKQQAYMDGVAATVAHITLACDKDRDAAQASVRTAHRALGIVAAGLEKLAKDGDKADLADLKEFCLGTMREISE